MADLSELQSTLPIKIVGADSTGAESSFVNASVNGDLGVSDGLSSGALDGSITLVANTVTELTYGSTTARKFLCGTPNGKLFWGRNNTVTLTTGTPWFTNQFASWALDPTDANAKVYVIAATAVTIVGSQSP